MSKKIKPAKIVKYFNKEKYIFIGGTAIVPNMTFSKQPVKITLKEFKELTCQN